MKSNRYRYEGSNTIEILGYDPARGGIVGAVMVDGKCKFEGFLFPCIRWLANHGDKKAIEHLREYTLRTNEHESPVKVNRNGNGRIFNRRRTGQSRDDGAK